MAVTVQMQFASAVTELYQDAFVGSSIENGTTIIPTTSFDFPLYMPSCIRHDYLSICLICNVPQLL